MENQNNICKEGIVRAIHGEEIEVEIVISSACSECHAKSICIPSDHRKETVTALSLYDETFEIGDKVQLVLRGSAGTKAVVLAYLIPVILLLATLLSIYTLTHKELLSVVLSFVPVIIYYFILKKLNHKWEKEFTFFVKKLNE